jgi:hypothetical protein
MDEQGDCVGRKPLARVGKHQDLAAGSPDCGIEGHGLPSRGIAGHRYGAVSQLLLILMHRPVTRDIHRDHDIEEFTGIRGRPQIIHAVYHRGGHLTRLGMTARAIG